MADERTGGPPTDDMSTPEEKDRRTFFRDLFWTTGFQIFGTVVAGLILLVGGFVVGRVTKSSGTHWAAPENVRFVIEDDVNGGVWGLTGTVTQRLLPHTEKPPNAVRWFAEGEPVIVRCTQAGTGYAVQENGHEATWHWYGKLQDETWIPLAAFRQTSKDGSQGVATC